VIKNYPQVAAGLELWLQRYKRHSVAYFRAMVWEVFQEILVQTPQFSGNAVANWNLSAGQPDYTSYVQLSQGLTPSGHVSHAQLRQKGDLPAIDIAMQRNLPKCKAVQLGQDVFFTNAAMGDDDGGRSSQLYLESLQDPAYWEVKLRAVNKPYETAAETVMHFNLRKMDEGKVAPFL
jgi:hypothetical protein